MRRNRSKVKQRNEKEVPKIRTSSKEATTGFEPVIKVLQTYALPLGYVAVTHLDKYTMPA